MYSAAADRHCRWPGEPAGPDRHRETVRGPEVLQPDQPCMGGLPHVIQRRGMEEAAAGPAGDVPPQFLRGCDQGA